MGEGRRRRRKQHWVPLEGSIGGVGECTGYTDEGVQLPTKIYFVGTRGMS